LPKIGISILNDIFAGGEAMTMLTDDYQVFVAVRVEGETELFGFPTEEGAESFAEECRDMGAEVIIGRPIQQTETVARRRAIPPQVLDSRRRVGRRVRSQW
jgi:hypothetical protein